MAIRLLLADPHQMVREGVRAFLDAQPDVVVVGEAADGPDLLALADELQPDVVVMETDLAGLDGVETAARLAIRHPAIKVIALSAQRERKRVVAMLQAGAAAYVTKAAVTAELVRAIHAVTQGHRHLGPIALHAVLSDPQEGETWYQPPSIPELTERERAVLQRLAGGETSAAIAASLSIAPATVEVHRRNIKRKLALSSIADLTRYAIREGLLRL